jgi:hypothetical protein
MIPGDFLNPLHDHYEFAIELAQINSGPLHSHFFLNIQLIVFT